MADRPNNARVVAESVREAFLEAATLAYEDAGIRGLCGEGRWEAALTAMRELDLSALLGRSADSRAPLNAPDSDR